jgi:hypothetical protein
MFSRQQWQRNGNTLGLLNTPLQLTLSHFHMLPLHPYALGNISPQAQKLKLETPMLFIGNAYAFHWKRLCSSAYHV